MKQKIQNILQKSQQKTKNQLEIAKNTYRKDPSFSGSKVKHEISHKIEALVNGGISSIHNLVCRIGLAKDIDNNLHLFKVHKPYHESDHILNLAYNTVCGGTNLDDIELLRNDLAYLKLLGTSSIPDPTTAGDFCRRLEEKNIIILMDTVNQSRKKVWQQQPNSFFKEANIDVDGIIIQTYGECKKGIGLSYKGIWGYHPLLVSLAETKEPLFIVNRSGNQTSQDGCKPWLDRAGDLCKESGFKKIRFRGDSAFALTCHFDEWDQNGYYFVFSASADQNKIEIANLFDEQGDWDILVRKAEHIFQRQHPENEKQKVIVEKGYLDIVQKSEEIIEFMYQPVKCKKEYRIVAVRRLVSIQRFGEELHQEHRYFFYFTNDSALNMYEVVKHANIRCDQENLNAQLQNGTCSLKAPLDNLHSNWAWMVITSLAWSFKSWASLLLPQGEATDKEHEKDKKILLTIEFRTFINRYIKIPAQVINHARSTILKFLSHNPQIAVIIRLAEL